MIERAVTLFPQPDSPTTPRIVPGSIANETSSTAATGPSSNMNSVRRFRISSRGCTIRISLPRLRRSFRFDPDAPQIVPGGRGTNSPDSLLHRVKRGPDRNEIVCLALAGVEDGIIVLFEVGVYPKQKRRVELVLEHPLGEPWKLDLLHVHLDAQFFVLVLENGGDLSHPHRMRADQQCEMERQSILIENSVAVGVRPSRLAQ